MAELLEARFGQRPSIYFDVESGAVTASLFLRQCPRRAVLEGKLREAQRFLTACGLDAGSWRFNVRKVTRQEWLESWRRHFKPFTVAEVLLVKPSWSRRKPTRGQELVVLDPGLSFGTGQHPTTRFCLEQIARARDGFAKPSLLDVGTGSGILAIAAAKLGYNPVRAFDFDPAAVRVAKENARKNGARIRITRGDIAKTTAERAKYHVVCANLTADLLESCAGKLKRLVRPDGLLVLAGILRTQVRAVRGCYEKQGACVVAQEAQGEWESLALRSAGS